LYTDDIKDNDDWVGDIEEVVEKYHQLSIDWFSASESQHPCQPAVELTRSQHLSPVVLNSPASLRNSDAGKTHFFHFLVFLLTCSRTSSLVSE